MKNILSEDDRRWIGNAKQKKEDFVIVVTDEFSYEDYPVGVKKADLALKKIEYSNKSMQRVRYVLDVKTGKVV